ncbi:imidazoleglycerol phosphate synthase, cyclase subunit [Oleiphilus messinensis]|uniref:imidazole glycerol-phosphate synthase n=1 Tax=Oleiphilus messinensis TaxID=141451 RepID=A0A1Y0IGG9_9GAMM|nr:AglZ/HisF2 family acetamidino modification protein [Oleiphilus messinensis]ARU59568.1 imidazoleglycerol phosphate synthase, cyclase subunit [Oleiphilus messinensis]
MLRVRVIPSLLLRDGGLVKGRQFKHHKYVGDPVNAVKIFNEKEVDELVFLDISATSGGQGPNYELLVDIANEAFMPFGYGGGITSCDEIEKLFKIGIEKVILNTSAYSNPDLIRNASRVFGSQSIVASIDVKTSFLGRSEVYVQNGTRGTKINPLDYARKMQDLGAGEILLCSIDREGTGKGYDLNLLKAVSESVDIPVVAAGGAGKLEDMSKAVSEGGVSAVAAGDMFVFHGKHKAVLITYPSYDELKSLF